MKFSLKLSSLVLGSLVAIGSNSVAHAQADSTGVIPLVGLPTLKQSSVPNQGGYDKAWTSYFIGQQRCKSAPSPFYSSTQVCATINAAGAVHVSSPKINLALTTGVPDGLAAIGSGLHSECGGGYSVTIFPTGQNYLTGSAPTNWDFNHVYQQVMSCI